MLDAVRIADERRCCHLLVARGPESEFGPASRDRRLPVWAFTAFLQTKICRRSPSFATMLRQFEQDFGMAYGDVKQHPRGAGRVAAALLPILERVGADT